MAVVNKEWTEVGKGKNKGEERGLPWLAAGRMLKPGVLGWVVGDYNLSEREPSCPFACQLYLSVGAWQHDSNYTLFPGIIRLCPLTSSSRRRTGKLPELKHLAHTRRFCQSYCCLTGSFSLKPAHLPQTVSATKVNTDAPLSFAPKWVYNSCSFLLQVFLALWPPSLLT